MAADQQSHTSQPEAAALLALDAGIAAAEDRADRAFFERLLHPAFTMRRPGGRVDARQELLDGLAPGAERRMHDVELLHLSAHRAVLTCLVTKTDPAEPVGSQQHTFHNLRVYLRDEGGPSAPHGDAASGWRLLAWLNEPA